MKIKDTFHGIKGEAMRLMFNQQKALFFDQYSTVELEKPNSPEEWIATFPEAHFYEYHVTGYYTSLLYVAGLYDYVPHEPTQYYDATKFARCTEKFIDACLLYLLKSNEKDAEKSKCQVMTMWEDIVTQAQALLEKNKSDKFLVGSKYSLADFTFIGPFLACMDQPIAEDIAAIIKKYKPVEAYLHFHRQEFLPLLIEGGRFTKCYATHPYSELFQLIMAYPKIKTKIIESKELKFTIAGIVYNDFNSALEMFARTLGQLKNDHIFENLYYRDIASSILFAEKPYTMDKIGEALYQLNNYYGYLRSTSPNKRWPVTLSDVYTAVAVEEVCKVPELNEVVKAKFSELYAYETDFLMRYKRAKHCIVLKSAPGPDFPLGPQAVALLGFMIKCRHDLHDVMRNMGFQTVETIYPLLSNYEEVLGKMIERKDVKDGDVEIFAYIDSNQASDFMLGYSGIKFMEDRGICFGGCNYEFAKATADKEPMKDSFIANAIPTAPYVFLKKWDEEAVKKSGLMFPAIVKLSDGYASYGMTKDSKCKDIEALKKVVDTRLEQFFGHPLLVESFIEGPEYTVVITGIYNKDVHVFTPLQRVFDDNIPEADRWLFFEFYWKSPLQKLFFKKVIEKELAETLIELAKKAYSSVKGNGYGRVDIRLDKKSGKFYVLEVNCMCAVGFETSSFYALRESGQKLECLFEDIFYYGKLKMVKNA